MTKHNEKMVSDMSHFLSRSTTWSEDNALITDEVNELFRGYGTQYLDYVYDFLKSYKDNRYNEALSIVLDTIADYDDITYIENIIDFLLKTIELPLNFSLKHDTIGAFSRIGKNYRYVSLDRRQQIIEVLTKHSTTEKIRIAGDTLDYLTDYIKDLDYIPLTLIKNKWGLIKMDFKESHEEITYLAKDKQYLSMESNVSELLDYFDNVFLGLIQEQDMVMIEHFKHTLTEISDFIEDSYISISFWFRDYKPVFTHLISLSNKYIKSR